MTRPVHLDVLRRWRLEGMGLRAGAGGLLASVVAFALGAPSAWHLGAIVLGAAFAAAWPLRSDERRALGWVGERVGLAYETAWELSLARPPRDERAGALRSAVEVQGRLSVRDLRPPAAAAWWLPLATVAFGLWLWSAWGAGGGTGLPAGPAPGPPPTTATTPAPADDARVEDAALADPAAPDAPEDATEARSDAGSGDATSAGSGSPGEGGAPAERDVLDRFLDRLRERPPEDEAARARRAAAAAAEDADEESDEPAVPGGDALRSGEAPPGQDPESDRRDGGEGDEERMGEADDGEGEGRTDDEAEGEPGDGGSPEGEGPEAPGDPGSGPDEAAGGGGDPLGVDEGGDDGSAGIGVSAPGEAGPAADPAAGDPEPLPSLLGPGEELPIGGVQLPGVGPEGGFPSGPAGTAFRRGVEEALNEGDLPVAYQEVIRNYFR
ncbi:MAG: hypothetical protein K0A98_12635 [Trueperaceae bacterium]|nr:hypothetical protein [Trueperaceae bacterium]